MDGQQQQAPPTQQKPRPVPMEKRIYGVPVFPGPSSAPQGNPVSPGPVQGVNMVPRSPAVQATRPAQVETTSPESEAVLRRRSMVSASPSMSSIGQASVASVAATIAPAAAAAPPSVRWKLRHVDFMPVQIKSKKDDDYERFQMLIERANLWSTHNPQCLIFSCETVTWSAVDRTVYTDSGILQKSMTSDKKTRYMRGLRVWYFIYDETFFDKSSCPGPFKIGCVNYTTEGKADNFVTLLSKINADMFKRTVAGKILKVETLMMLSDVGDVDICTWAEQPDKSRDYTYFLRLFYIFKKEGMDDCKYGNIGIRDFQPSYDQRTPHNQGYETFSELWQKAARWVYTNSQIRLINAQGLYVKVKKESDKGDSNPNLWDRCTHREHASAYGSLSHAKTEYYQILRLVYHQPPDGAPISNSTSSLVVNGTEAAASRKFYYKSFSPSALKRAYAGAMSESDPEPLPAENLFEDIKQLEEKINAWLHHSDAKIASVETVPTRLFTGGQEMLGPEATFVYNDREKNQNRENWRVNIRLYIEGDYRDPPAVWRNSYTEKSVALTTGPNISAQATL